MLLTSRLHITRGYSNRMQVPVGEHIICLSTYQHSKNSNAMDTSRRKMQLPKKDVEKNASSRPRMAQHNNIE